MGVSAINREMEMGIFGGDWTCLEEQRERESKWVVQYLDKAIGQFLEVCV